MNTKKHQNGKKHKQREMQAEAWSPKSTEQEKKKKKNIERAELQPET